MYDIQQAFRASTLAEALSLYEAHPTAIFCAGGTDVMIRLRHFKEQNATIISLLDVAQLKGVALESNGDITIGAGTSFGILASHPLLLEKVPHLAYSCSQVGSPQIRAVATIGGNICNGAVSADSVPALLTLDAQLTLVSGSGTRTIPLAQFHTGPGKTQRNPGEILTTICIPAQAYVGGGMYIKSGQRNAMEIATLGCAAHVTLDTEGTVTRIALAYGVAAPTPIRCHQTESLLTGRKIDDAFYQTLRQNVVTELSPRDSWRASKTLRIQLIKELGQRAVAGAIAANGGEFHV